MAKMSVEIDGSVEEVVRVIQALGGAAQRASAGDDGGSTETPSGSGGETTPAAGARMSGAAEEAPPGAWTEALAADFLSGLDPESRRVALHVWRAGAAGIHRSVLCQRGELTPGELRSLLVRMSHALRRFQRERGMTLSRPVAADSPLQSYFVDAGFAAVANSQMFDERRRERLADGAGHP